MIDGLIRWSLRHRTIVVALAAAFLVWGGWTATRIPLDVLPDLTAPTVTILAEAPGMDPLEIESLVTFPIESALNGAAGVRRVRSATAVGVAVVWVEFDWGQDINRARQTVAEKLTLVSGSLPPDVAPPFLAPVSSIMARSCSSISNRIDTLRSNFGRSQRRSSGVVCWRCQVSPR